MAFPVYLRMNLYGSPVRGPVLLEDKLPASEVHEFSHDMHNLPQINGMFHETIRVHTPIILYKPIDCSSVHLIKAFLKSDHASQAELFWYHFDEKEKKNNVYFRHILEDVKIRGFSHILPDVKSKALEGYAALERLELNYTYITWEFCKGMISYRDKWELSHIEEFKAGSMAPEELAALLSAPALTDELDSYFSKKKPAAGKAENAAAPSDKSPEQADKSGADETKEPSKPAQPAQTPDDAEGWWLPKESVSPVDGIAPEGKVVGLIEMEDALFRHNSTVFLPDVVDAAYPEPGAEDAGDAPADGADSSNEELSVRKRCEGLSMVYQVLMHLQEKPDGFVCQIAGHTDTSGDAAYNHKLSHFRANAVYYIIDGSDASRTAWGDQFKEELKDGVHTKNIEDLQQILAWVSHERNWPCHPGPIDGIAGSKTQSAVREFQKSYNADPEFPADIEPDGIAKKETWKAFFDVYQSTLAKMSGMDRAQFDAQYRCAAKWKDSFKLTGCGEQWPIEEESKDDYRSQTNRRVEVLVFDPGEAPALACIDGSCAGKSCPVYGAGPDGAPAFEAARIFYDYSPVNGANEFS